jgi:hypothetical protein
MARLQNITWRLAQKALAAAVYLCAAAAFLYYVVPLLARQCDAFLR